MESSGATASIRNRSISESFRSAVEDAPPPAEVQPKEAEAAASEVQGSNVDSYVEDDSWIAVLDVNVLGSASGGVFYGRDGTAPVAALAQSKDPPSEYLLPSDVEDCEKSELCLFASKQAKSRTTQQNKKEVFYY
ncbi:hypothetical protein ACLOJK_039464 [Asimina triloba]